MLAMLLNHDNECLVQNVLWILRNLSDVGNKQVPLISLDATVPTPMYPWRCVSGQITVLLSSLQTTFSNIRHYTRAIIQYTLIEQSLVLILRVEFYNHKKQSAMLIYCIPLATSQL